MLSLLVVITSQIAGGAANTTTAGRKRILSDSQARLALDRIGADLGGMLRRRDIDYLFEKNSGNDRMFFYSEAPGFTTSPANQSNVSLVGYRINSDNQLERLGKRLTFNQIQYLAVAMPSQATRVGRDLSTEFASALASGSSDPDWAVLADQVFRLEIQFIDRATGAYLNPTGNLRELINPRATPSAVDIGAIVVTLVVLDGESQKIAPNLSGVVSAFSDSGTSNLLQEWQDTVTSSLFAATSGLPLAAASQVRVYQRTYPIPR